MLVVPRVAEVRVAVRGVVGGFRVIMNDSCRELVIFQRVVNDERVAAAALRDGVLGVGVRVVVVVRGGACLADVVVVVDRLLRAHRGRGARMLRVERLRRRVGLAPAGLFMLRREGGREVETRQERRLRLLWLLLRRGARRVLLLRERQRQ